MPVAATFEMIGAVMSSVVNVASSEHSVLFDSSVEQTR